MMKKEKSNYSIQAVEYALDVLEQFMNKANELGVTELSRRLNLSKNNVFRLLATLESRSYVEQNKSTNSYRLGIKNLELGQAVIRQMGLHRQARSVLESLVRDCNETSDLAILRGSQVYYLYAVESFHPVRVVPRMGDMLPAYCTAAGKVLLANGTAPELNDYCSEDFRQLTPNTITDRNEFKVLLGKIAAQDYALEDEEKDLGVRSVAAPIRDYTGGVVGAVSVSGPLMRFNNTRIHDELVPLVKRAAVEISMRIGYYSAHIARISLV